MQSLCFLILPSAYIIGWLSSMSPWMTCLSIEIYLTISKIKPLGHISWEISASLPTWYWIYLRTPSTFYGGAAFIEILLQIYNFSVALPTPGLRSSKHHLCFFGTDNQPSVGLRSSKHHLFVGTDNPWIAFIETSSLFPWHCWSTFGWVAFIETLLINVSLALTTLGLRSFLLALTINLWLGCVHRNIPITFLWHWQPLDCVHRNIITVSLALTINFGLGCVHRNFIKHLLIDVSLALTTPGLRSSKHQIVSLALTIHLWTWLYHRRVNTPTWHDEWYR